MPYPKDFPVAKHDLYACVGGENKLPIMHNVQDMARAVKSVTHRQQELVCPVYTYRDAPSTPLPRNLTVLGFFSVMEGRVLEADSMLQLCTIAVKRLDRNASALSSMDVRNSHQFCKLTRKMRNEGLVALCTLNDKNRRLGILQPMEYAAAPRNAGIYVAEDFAVCCFIGKEENVLEKISFLLEVTGEQLDGTRKRKEPPNQNNHNLFDKKRNHAPSSVAFRIGKDSCCISFQRNILQRLFKPMDHNWFGLEYSFMLRDGSDHAAGVGNAVDVPEWLVPLPLLEQLATQAGLELEYACNFHEFYARCCDKDKTLVEQAMTTRKALNRRGSISRDEWDVARLYMALKFRKVGESKLSVENETQDKTANNAEDFYNDLKRHRSTRVDSRLYHLRNFNGWIKDTQIQELRPETASVRGRQAQPLRVLDLACGKGGDLNKWLERGVSTYVGIDVALESLSDAAKRAIGAARYHRGFMPHCSFVHADLGVDVPGRPRVLGGPLQILLSWSLQTEASPHVPSGHMKKDIDEPQFSWVQGGGISEHECFDVVSIQFALHYMMSSEQRAKRFFHTVSELLDINGNLIATTVDARMVLEHLMDTGADFHSFFE